MVDEVVAELERRGHPGVRPGHGFALRAIDGGADTAAELGRRLSVTKQAAAKRSPLSSNSATSSEKLTRRTSGANAFR